MGQNDLTFKVFNKEIIDCSSCYNAVYPNPESIDVLLDMIFLICKSPATLAICRIFVELFLDNQTIALISPFAEGYGFRSDNILQIGKEAEENKVAGLYYETEEKLKNRIKPPPHYHPYYILPIGLNGIEKAIQLIKNIQKAKYDDLPEILRNKKFKSFRFYIWAIWSLDAEFVYHEIEEGTKVFSYSKGTAELTAKSSNLTLTISPYGDIQLSPHYLKFLDYITEALGTKWPYKYEITAVNGVSYFKGFEKYNLMVKPFPKSKIELLDIILKLCESEIIETIIKTHFKIISKKPFIIDINSPWIEAPYGKYFKDHIEKIIEKYELKEGINPEKDKIKGILIRKDLETNKCELKSRENDNYSYSIPAGLNGVSTAVEILKGFLLSDKGLILKYFKEEEFLNFSKESQNIEFYSEILAVWRYDANYINLGPYENLLDFKKWGRFMGTSITTYTRYKFLNFNFNEIDKSFFYDIKSFLNENWPDKYLLEIYDKFDQRIELNGV